MAENVPLHSPGGGVVVVAAIVAALIVLGFCVALDRHYRRQRNRDLHWYADRLTALQRERRATASLADAAHFPRSANSSAGQRDSVNERDGRHGRPISHPPLP